MKIVIVGGVAGGASAAARLRRLMEDAEIILFEQGPYISYANCGLPYYIGGEIRDKSALTLQTPESFSTRFRVDVRVNHRVTAIDRSGKTVRVQPAGGAAFSEPYDKLILSPGASPLIPDAPGLDSKRVFTLRTIPDTFQIHEFIRSSGATSALIAGGGYIGVEMAENLMRAGLTVTLAQRSDHLIPSLDPDMAADLHNYLREKGVRLLLNSPLHGVEDQGDHLTVHLKTGDVDADLMLLSVGVTPDSELAKDAGLSLGVRGTIAVNEHMQTSDPDLYAVGDAVEVRDRVTGAPAFIPLAGPANKQGRIAADHIAGRPSAYGGSQGSAILRAFDMTVATTGLNEKKALAAGLDFAWVHTFSASHAGYYPGACNMSVKILFEKLTGRLLGAQIVGFEGVDKRCDVLAVAIRAGMTVHDLTELELCYAPPFSSAKDPVNMAGFVAENVLTGAVKVAHWRQLPAILEGEGNLLLDVRTEGEVKKGRIEGSLSIPLDSLRDRLDELPRDKTVYVHCHSGLRSYLACRILSQNGFDCYNLSGGWRLYASMEQNNRFNEKENCLGVPYAR